MALLIPVADEAYYTAKFLEWSWKTWRGVTGIHRLLSHRNIIEARVIVAAGMEGALASVVGGLVDIFQWLQYQHLLDMVLILMDWPFISNA